MIIKRIDIRKFGVLQSCQENFSDGLNIIYGENEAGKSTMQQFLKGMLFGLEKKRGKASEGDPYQKYEPWDAPSFYSGSMVFETGGREFLLERNFYSKEKTSRLLNVQDFEELSVEHGDLQMLLGGISKAAYENTYFISQDRLLPGKDLGALLADEKNNFSRTGDGSFQLSAAVRTLQDRRKRYEKQRKILQTEREERFRQLETEEAVLMRDYESVKIKIQEKKEERKRIEYRIESFRKENIKSAGGIVPPGDENEKRAWNPWIIFGVVCFLLNHLLKGTLHLPGAVFFILQAIFAGMVVFGIVRVFQQKKAEELREIQERSSTEQKEEQQEAEINRMYESVKMIQGALAAIEEEGRDRELSLENIREQKKEQSTAGAEELELLRKEEAVCLAEEILKKLSADFQADRDDFLNEQMSEIISQITKGKYDDIRINEKHGIEVVSEFQTRKPEAYSQATMQQMYFAYRMAAGRLLAGEEKLPLMFDEAFAGYDRQRLLAVLQWLARQEQQVFLFTCRELEADILRENQIKFQEIRL